ncbi:unnamed protein product, partial [marine sediment metagenome]
MAEFDEKPQFLRASVITPTADTFAQQEVPTPVI